MRRRTKTLVDMNLRQGLNESHTKLFVLQKVNEQTRNSLLDGIDNEAILALTEVALNVILGTIPADERQLVKLRQHRYKLHELLKHSTSLPRRERLLSEKDVGKVILDPSARHIARYP